MMSRLDMEWSMRLIPTKKVSTGNAEDDVSNGEALGPPRFRSGGDDEAT